MSKRILFQALLAVVTVLFLAGSLCAQGQSEDAFERVKAVQERHTEKFLAQPGVVGTAVGLNKAGRHVVLILLAKEGVPGIPEDLEGVPVRRVVTGTIHALKPPADRPAKPPANRPPKPPRGLTATAVGESQINLSWTDRANNEDGFRIECEIAGFFQEIGTVGANVTSYSDIGLDPSTTYTYRVCAYNGAGDSAYSNEASATTEGGTVEAPEAPSNLTAAAVSSSQIDLAWTDNADNETGFKIERDSVVIDMVAADVTSYSDTGLDPSTTYTYRVCASNGAGDSPYSNAASATTQGEPPEPPAPPTELAATAVSSSQIDLAWTDNADNETGFKIQRDSVVIDTVGADVTSYSDTGLNPSTTYTYRVCAYNDAGDSAYCDAASATTQSEQYPPRWCERPVPIGVSTGHPSITAGTIGCRVRGAGGSLYALSNNHVYAAENQAQIGDPVIQPGTYDGGISPRDDIGTLYAFEEIVWYPLGLNTIDAAIASTTADLVGQATPPEGYGTPGSGIVAPSLGMAVQKYGRTTGLTQGTVTGVNAAIIVQYSAGRLAIFTGQVMIEGTGESFSAGGDSGSLVVTGDENCSPVGLLFAGSASATYANLIGPVLAHFGVTVDGQ